jgi:hypothetical protein
MSLASGSLSTINLCVGLIHLPDLVFILSLTSSLEMPLPSSPWDCCHCLPPALDTAPTAPKAAFQTFSDASGLPRFFAVTCSCIWALLIIAGINGMVEASWANFFAVLAGCREHILLTASPPWFAIVSFFYRCILSSSASSDRGINAGLQPDRFGGAFARGLR